MEVRFLRSEQFETVRRQKAEGRRLLTLLFALMLVVMPSRIYAGSLSAPPASHVKVAVMEVLSDFPDTVDFVLQLKEYAAARAILNYKPVGRQITSEQEADIEGTVPPGTDIRVTLDLSTHYMPPGVEVEYYWTLFDDTGASTDTAVKTFELLDERYSWQTYTDAESGLSVHWYTVR